MFAGYLANHDRTHSVLVLTDSSEPIDYQGLTHPPAFWIMTSPLESSLCQYPRCILDDSVSALTDEIGRTCLTSY
jgi:hypothetical protein